MYMSNFTMPTKNLFKELMSIEMVMAKEMLTIYIDSINQMQITPLDYLVLLITKS
ncbi:hypothetical protein D3C86_1195990 [compost metagenome]